MIYLYCLKKLHNLYYSYIKTLVSLYNFPEVIIINDINEMQNYINKNNLSFSSHILINDFKIFEENDSIKIKNYYSLNLPINVNNTHSYNKIYDICTYNIKEEDQPIIKYFNERKIKVNDLSKSKKEDIYTILSKHKIFLNLHVNYENAYENANENANDNHNDNNNKLFYDILLHESIYNNVIIINDKRNMDKRNINKNNYNSSFINNFLIDVSIDFLPNFAETILKNYNEMSEYIYKDLNLNKSYNLQLIKAISKNILNKIQKVNDFGFIITRHVNSENVNNYWIESYKSIRKYYDYKIIIIDDNSNYSLIKYDFELINCEIIQSEYKHAGEILPYYYMYKYNLFKKAVIIHDSTFINKYIHFEDIKNVKFIWHFTHHWDNDETQLDLLNKLNYNDILSEFHNEKDKWMGCYGVQSVIEYDFLKYIWEKYDFYILVKYINTRDLRMDFERIFGLICNYENKNFDNPSMYGIIHHYIHWGYTYDSYLKDKYQDSNKLDHLDIIKVWSGR